MCVYVTPFPFQCWSSDGYHLWMLPSSRDRPTSSNQGRSSSESSEAGGGAGGVAGRNQVLVMRFMRNSLVTNPVVVSLHKEPFVVPFHLHTHPLAPPPCTPHHTPFQSNHRHLLLQGSTRLYVNTSSSITHQGRGVANSKATPTTNNVMLSSPQWKVIPLPTSYMTLNWPIQVSRWVWPNGVGVA